MIDQVQKDETEAKTEVQKVDAEAVALWHEVEAFFAKLKAKVEGDANATQVLTTFQAATHEVVGTEAPAGTETAGTPAVEGDAGTGDAEKGTQETTGASTTGAA